MTEEKNLSQLAKEVGMNYYTLKNRLNSGMTLKEALSKPVRKKTVNLAKRAKENNINEVTVRNRMRTQNMTLEEALKTPLKQGYKHLWQNKKDEMLERVINNNKKRRKKYIAIDPKGSKIVIENLKEFCEKMGWKIKSVRTSMTARTKHKGWEIRVKEND